MAFPRPGGGGGGAVSSVNTATGAVVLPDLNNSGQVTSIAHVTTGVLPVANGGTANTTNQAAIDSLSGVVSSGFYLRGNGTHALPNALLLADASDQLLAANGTNFLLLAGRGGGQTASGGTAASDNLVLQSTSAGSPTGTVQVLGGTVALTVGSPNFKPGVLAAHGAVSSEEGFLGLNFVGSQSGGGKCALDLRSYGGTFAVPSHTTSGTTITSLNSGACTTDTTTPPVLADIAEIDCVTTEDTTTSAHGSKYVFQTCPNGSTAKQTQFVINQDGSVTVTAGVTLSGQVLGSTNLPDLSIAASATQNLITVGGGAMQVRNYTVAAGIVPQRFNGTTGSPTAILSGQTVTAYYSGGSFDTSGVAAFLVSSKMSMVATENWANSGVSGTAGSLGSKIVFSVCKNTTAALVTAFTIDQDGSLLMGQSGAKLSFFAVTAVVQQNGTGNVHTVTAGSTTNVFTNTTFDGSTGSTAYTVGDIVKALKAYGLLAA